MRDIFAMMIGFDAGGCFIIFPRQFVASVNLGEQFLCFFFFVTFILIPPFLILFYPQSRRMAFGQ